MEHHFLGVHRSNLFLSNLLSVYRVSSYVDITSVTKRFWSIKETVDKYFSKTFNIYMPILIKRILLSALKSWLSRFKYIHPFSDFCINLKTKLVETFLTLQKNFTWIKSSQPWKKSSRTFVTQRKITWNEQFVVIQFTKKVR